jgi:orotidine-5'-phosphate decarboxylase
LIAPYGDRLERAIAVKASRVCVGNDPRPELLPSEYRPAADADARTCAAAIGAWAAALIDVVAPLVPVVKPQLAFFEAYGAAGVAAYEATVAAARERGLLVIADAKRGDIGSTAEAYAQAHFDHVNADALTVNAYLGLDTLEPFLARCRDAGKGIYVLVRTSNPGARDLQDLRVDGRPLYAVLAERLAELGEGYVGDCGWSSVGAVTGATYPAELSELRSAMPHTPFLVPGYGAQGGTARDTEGAFDAAGGGAVVNSSRGITFAFGKGAHALRFGDARWRESVEHAVTEMRNALEAVRPRGPRSA